MTKIEEKLSKWESVSVAYQTWLTTLSPKYKIGKTIYTQLGETFGAIVKDLQELNEHNADLKILYKKINALRLDVDSAIVDDIKKTVDEVFVG